MQPYPRSPDLVWLGHLHGTGCLSTRALDTRFLAVEWRLCFGLCFTVTRLILVGVKAACVSVRVFVWTRKSWLGLVVCAFGLEFRLRPANPGWDVDICVFVRALRLHLSIPGWGRLCVCSSTGFHFFPTAVAGMCAPGMGYDCTLPILAAVLGCVCLCASSACTPQVLAGVGGLCVCA